MKNKTQLFHLYTFRFFLSVGLFLFFSLHTQARFRPLPAHLGKGLLQVGDQITTVFQSG